MQAVRLGEDRGRPARTPIFYQIMSCIHGTGKRDLYPPLLRFLGLLLGGLGGKCISSGQGCQTDNFCSTASSYKGRQQANSLG